MAEYYVTLVKSEDGEWEGLYFNGELWDQNHSISLADALAAICSAAGFHFTERWVEMDPYNFNHLPTYEGDIDELEKLSGN